MLSVFFLSPSLLPLPSFFLFPPSSVSSSLPLPPSHPSLPLADGVFDYDEYCKDELEKKKREGTYRVFPRVDRKAMQFPYARDRITDSDITVWCSNDYLGMSRHPKV